MLCYSINAGDGSPVDERGLTVRVGGEGVAVIGGGGTKRLRTVENAAVKRCRLPDERRPYIRHSRRRGGRSGEGTAATGSLGIAPALEDFVEHSAMLVDGTPQSADGTADHHMHPIRMLDVAWPRRPAANVSSDGRTESSALTHTEDSREAGLVREWADGPARLPLRLG